MAVISERHGLAYFPVPKVACTSLKHMMYRLETGAGFVPRSLPGRGWRHIHEVFESVPMPDDRTAFDGLFRFAVVRDPVARLVSAYANRVLHHGELSAGLVGSDLLARHGLPETPPFEVFLDRLDAYREISRSIRHHTDPQTLFLGRDPAWFDAIVPLSRLSDLVALLRERTGIELRLDRFQETPASVPRPALTPALRALVMERYRDDLAAFGRVLAGG